MGLDMFAFKTKNQPDSEIDFIIPEGEFEKLFYWRKNYDIHDWMEALYEEKGGLEEFNCVNVQLTLDDLNNLLTDLNLEENSSNSDSEEEVNEDLAFIKEATKAINDGYVVYYNSWY